MSDKPLKGRCGAKKRDGSFCELFPITGKKRCRLHGGKSTGPKDKTKMLGNQNAVKTGEFAKLFVKFLAPEELEAAEEMDMDVMAQLDNEIRLITIRERRMLERIEKVRKGWDDTKVKVKKELVRKKGKQNPVTIYSDTGNPYMGLSGNPDEYVMEETERLEEKGGELGRLLAIEEALTRVQGRKAQLLDLKFKVESGGYDDGSIDGLTAAIRDSAAAIRAKEGAGHGTN